ncbi:tetratricopeptide repeat-containing sensor histidine kinase [Larkinella humicola]|uniref:histidine kinase n=1 Tax=Larkinella humicola TaxID=2607654 RepID=A0A5N1JEF7_9BACT|nr:tetratricopeptide repeat-containing sensor histidine kinase [Larkinella humicola]KAA9349476.1 sensor histidine kinase [Larkinella humicola]
MKFTSMKSGHSFIGRLAWVLLIYWFSSCDFYAIRTIDHEAHVDSLIDRATVLKFSKGIERSRIYLDSAYARFPDAGIMDYYRKYDFLRGNYHDENFKPDYEKVQSYIDSMFGVLEPGVVRERYKKNYARIYLLRGDLFHHLRRYDEAYSQFFQGKILMESTFDSCQSSQYTSRIAGMNYQEKNYSKAATYYKQAFHEVMTCSNGGNFDDLFVSRQGYLSNIGLCYSKLDLPDSALHYYDQALRFIGENEHKFPNQNNFMAMARAVIYGNQATIYLQQGDLLQAETLLKESIRINRQTGYYNRDAQLSQAKLCELYLTNNRLAMARRELLSLKTSLDTLPHPDALLRWHHVQSQYFEKVHQISQAHYHLKNYLALKEYSDQEKAVFKGMDQALQNLDSQHKIELLSKKEELNRLYLMGAAAILMMALVIAFLIWHSWKRTRKNLLKLAALNQQIIARNTQLQTTLTELERSQQENARLMQIVAHDLRTPIGAISMAVDLLLEDQLRVHKPQYFLKMIKSSSANSLILIDNLLHSNTTISKKEPVELQDFLASCVDMLELKAREKQQSIHLEADEARILVDRQKMWRVISNLIANAIKFSSPESTITVRLKKRVHTVQISVQDRGIGIPASLKANIFDLFTVAKRPGTAGEKSFGMGLAISRQIVEAHQGKLWFESEENQGTTFYVELPI